MASVEIRRSIAAAPDEVWAVLANIERQGEWMVDVHTLRVVSEQKQGVGTVMHVRSRLFGLPVVRDVMEVVRWEPPRRIDIVHRGSFHGAGSFVLEPRDGETVFTWTEEFTPPLGMVGEVAFRLVVRPHLLRVFGRSMENVRRLAEGR
jgi:uncharacterized protein YndB with AHSA1/START domain